MSELLERVDSLQNTISKLLHRHKLLKQKHEALKHKYADLEEQHDEVLAEINQWEARYSSLKTANAMLGSKEYKTETKLKINAMIREIDQCIAQLAE
ncbi:MAG: hypothetical protein WBG71_03550 [Leeuwenhoekiella sp.]